MTPYLHLVDSLEAGSGNLFSLSPLELGLGLGLEQLGLGLGQGCQTCGLVRVASGLVESERYSEQHPYHMPQTHKQLSSAYTTAAPVGFPIPPL